MTETEKWISRRKAVWNKKLTKANLATPESIYDHINIHTEIHTALRVLEELNNIKAVMNEDNLRDKGIYWRLLSKSSSMGVTLKERWAQG